MIQYILIITLVRQDLHDSQTWENSTQITVPFYRLRDQHLLNDVLVVRPVT